MPALPYPAEINDLDTGKSYCWKVDGLVGDVPVAQSEVWEFKLRILKKDTEGLAYYVLDDKNSKTFELTEKVGVIYFERSPSDQLTYQVQNEKTGKVELAGKLSSVYGENKFSFDFVDFHSIRPKTLYTLQIKNSRGTSVQMRFLISK